MHDLTPSDAKKCKDCQRVFEDPHGLTEKCEMCRERDQSYVERAMQERLEALDDGE